RSYRSRHRWFVRAPACAPQFWTTWRYSVWPARCASAIAPRQIASSSAIVDVPTAWRGRCSPGAATAVRQLPDARAVEIATWTRLASSSRASLSVPTTWKAKSLSVRSLTPSPGGSTQFWQRPPSGTGSAASVNRSRWKARSTTVATHQPVIASLRSSKRPAAISAGDRRRDLAHGMCPQAARECTCEGVGRARRGVSGRHLVRPARLPGDRGRLDAGHPARVDEREVGKVGIDVQGDPVVAHPALDADAEGADLAWRRPVRVAPAAGVPVAPSGGGAERLARVDHRELERPDERTNEEAAPRQGEDGIGDELPRAVVRHLAAALDADRLDPPCRELGGSGQDMCLLRVPAQCQHRRVLEQEERVVDLVGDAKVDELVLERPCLPVADAPEPADLERHGGPGGQRRGVDSWIELGSQDVHGPHDSRAATTRRRGSQDARSGDRDAPLRGRRGPTRDRRARWRQPR